MPDYEIISPLLTLFSPPKIGWIGLAAVSGLRINEDYIVWPDKSSLDTLNATDPRRYVSKSTADTYMVIVLKIQTPYICNTRVTSLEQLSVAEFSGE